MSASSKTTLFILTCLGLVFFGFHLHYWPLGVDYHDSFYPVTELWKSGIQPYKNDFLFFNSPWLILFITPLTWLTQKGGQAALALITITTLIRGWKQAALGLKGYARPWSIAICLFNLHIFDLLWRGQIDAITLLGVLLAWDAIQQKNPYLLGIGWTIASVKPTSVLLFLLYTVYLAYTQKYLLRALVIPILTFLTSLPLFELDWPLRLLNRISETEMQQAWMTTWWRAGSYLEISAVWSSLIALLILLITLWILYKHSLKPDTITIGFLIVTSILIAPYALSYHYSVLMVIFLPPLLQKNILLIIPLYLLTYLPLVRLRYGPDVAWIDIVFPLVVWLCYVYILSGNSKNKRVTVG